MFRSPLVDLFMNTPHYALSRISGIDRSWDYYRYHCNKPDQRWHRKMNRRRRSNNR